MSKTHDQRKQEADQIIAAYTALGYDALWADGKGGGFWVKGESPAYRSLAQAKREVASGKIEIRRPCAVCGKSQYQRKVWEQFNHAVICYTCGRDWQFDGAGKPRRYHYSYEDTIQELKQAIYETPRKPTEGEIIWTLTGKNAQESGQPADLALLQLAAEGKAPANAAEREAYFSGYRESAQAEDELISMLGNIEVPHDPVTDEELSALPIFDPDAFEASQAESPVPESYTQEDLRQQFDRANDLEMQAIKARAQYEHMRKVYNRAHHTAQEDK